MHKNLDTKLFSKIHAINPRENKYKRNLLIPIKVKIGEINEEDGDIEKRNRDLFV